jgi:hypothetical protein
MMIKLSVLLKVFALGISLGINNKYELKIILIIPITIMADFFTFNGFRKSKFSIC